MSTPFLGEIIMFGGNFAPRGYALCDGQLLSINDNQALENTASRADLDFCLIKERRSSASRYFISDLLGDQCIPRAMTHKY